MNILLVDGNTNTGATAAVAALALRKKYPQAKLCLATEAKVFGGPDTFENIVYGTMTDENFVATENEKKSLGLRHGITLVPWEK